MRLEENGRNGIIVRPRVQPRGGEHRQYNENRRPVERDGDAVERRASSANRRSVGLRRLDGTHVGAPARIKSGVLNSATVIAALNEDLTATFVVGLAATTIHPRDWPAVQAKALHHV